MASIVYAVGIAMYSGLCLVVAAGPPGRPALDPLVRAARMEASLGGPLMTSGYRMGKRAVLLAFLLLTSVAGGAASGSSPASDRFTGQIEVGDCGGPSGTFEIVDGVERLRGHRCEGHIDSSDPRFTGTHVSVVNIDTYRGPDYAPPEGAFNVWTIVRRVENDEGAWQGAPTTTAWVDDPEAFVIDDPPAIVVFTGEGGYEGLTAIVTMGERIVASHARGYIFTGSPRQRRLSPLDSLPGGTIAPAPPRPHRQSNPQPTR